MPKYNLTRAQQELLAEVVAFFKKSGNEPLVHWQADQGHVLMGQDNVHLTIPVDELIVFEREELVSLRPSHQGATIVTLRQAAHDAIARAFEKPQSPPAIGQVGQVIYGAISGGSFQTAVGNHNILRITNATSAEIVGAIATLINDLRPIVRESLPTDEATAAEGDLQEIERQISNSQPDKSVLARRIRSVGRKFVDAIDWGVGASDAVATRAERVSGAIVKIGGLVALIGQLAKHL